MTIWLSVLGVALAAWAVFWLLWPQPLARLFMAAERRQGRLGQRRVRCGDIDWHTLEGGHGEPLLLLHGFNGDSYHFTRVSRCLGKHFRVIAPDLPGFGQTEFDGELDYGVEAQAERVLDLLDELGIERFYLGGSSMGGYIAAAIASRAPARVRALWLLNPGGLQTAPLSPLFEVVYQGGHNALVVRDRKDFRRLMDYCFVRPPWLPGPLARQLADRASRHSERAAQIFEAIRFRSTPLEELAPKLDVPSLIVWGQADQVLHPDGLKILAERMPHARTLILPATGHLPMIEKPKETAEAWISFAESQARQETRETAPV
ncbi:alpha/beta fold hydrolase [Wenzhouxiangella sp. EGI_FJ10305]|uniref:alpha/beta fold hydrolase n=1 Tax=Wenzhouxiangella sp. EGI_FJ10305 TaxID=3243768 RepID=UPI0035DEFE2F